MQLTINSFRQLFPLTRFFPLTFSKIPDISLIAVKFRDISRFSRQVVTLQLMPAPVAHWRKSLAAVRLACVAARLWRSGFNPSLWHLVSTWRSTECIFRD